MVERLKAAIEKARMERAGGAPSPQGAALSAPASGPARGGVDWSGFATFEPSPALLKRHRIVTRDKHHSVHTQIDVLRTRIAKICKDNGWRLVGVTSPTKGCGKSTLSANLAFSAARIADRRVALLDMDLRGAHQARMMGMTEDVSLAALLAGEATPQEALRRCGDNLLIGFNTVRRRDAAEVLQGAGVRTRLIDLCGGLGLDLAIVDLAPLLVGDEVIGMLPYLDAVLLVAGSGVTRAEHVAESERMIGDATPLLGVVLNKATEGLDQDAYGYYEPA